MSYEDYIRRIAREEAEKAVRGHRHAITGPARTERGEMTESDSGDQEWQEWMDKAQAIVDESDRKMDARRDAALLKDRRIAELERRVDDLEAACIKRSHALDAVMHALGGMCGTHDLDSLGGKLSERVAALQARHQKLLEAVELASVCRQDWEGDPVCTGCDELESTCICPMSDIRRAVAEDKEQAE